MKKFVLAAFTAVLCSVIISAGIAIKSHDDFEKLRMKSGWFGEYKPIPKCHIEVDEAKLETVDEGFKVEKMVTVDVFARCDDYQKNAQVTLEIWKEGKYFPHRVARISNNPHGTTFSGHDIHFVNMGVTCKNSNHTVYYGIASVQAIIKGKNKETPQVTSMSPTILPCGT
jgi:hypothetical protein